ncbi:hypothetical protein KCP75_17720 [Salmonella enterica subsp. enterica]|nr:hypothetical protein KCP75_17720 [Salmonella enterica subsp. enterica]
MSAEAKPINVWRTADDDVNFAGRLSYVQPDERHGNEASFTRFSHARDSSLLHQSAGDTVTDRTSLTGYHHL